MKIYIRTHAYNAAKTLEATIKSVLGQTYGDFVYYLCDNGSTDNGATRSIIEAYAARDKRIVPFYNEKNWDFSQNYAYLDLPRNILPNDYYCEIDADDTYIPTFLDDLLMFMSWQNLDIACAGANVYIAESGGFHSSLKLDSQLTIDGKGFADYFPTYYRIIRTSWGKLIKGHVLFDMITRYEDDVNYPVAYGGDTYTMLRALGNAKRMGIFPGVLYNYYASTSSVSFKYNPDRVRCCQVLQATAIAFLKRFGAIGPANYDFLLDVYLNDIVTTWQTIVNANVSTQAKLKQIMQILSSPFTERLLHQEDFRKFYSDAEVENKKRKNLFAQILIMMLDCGGLRDESMRKVALGLGANLYRYGFKIEANNSSQEIVDYLHDLNKFISRE